MKKLNLIMALMMTVAVVRAKTLIVYYSFTNNVHTIVRDLQTQIEADVIRIEPAEEGLDYAANNYAIGSAQIASIRSNPDNAASYPAIKPVDVNLADYDMVIIATPLWWSSMAAPLQTFLFSRGKELAGKNVGLIVSSASSGISGVVADARRLVPDARFLGPNLWIRSSQTSNCHSLLENWLADIDYNGLISGIPTMTESEDVRLIFTQGHLRAVGAFTALSLFDEAGMKVLDTHEDNVDTSALRQGIYIVKIGRGTSRIISQKIYISN